MNTIIRKKKTVPVSEESYEIVERKGLGHPDYIADSIAENFSRTLCKEYLKRFDTILHHNVDKLDLVGGDAEPDFRGGVFKKPITCFFSGRATQKADDKVIPVKKIAVDSAKEWIKENFRYLDPDKQFKYIVATKSGSSDLQDIFKRKDKFIGANDTSAGVSYYPLSMTEEIVLKTERFLNSRDFKKKNKWSGEDVKVMGVRLDNRINLTIGHAFVDKHLKSLSEYNKKKKELIHIIENRLDNEKINVSVNNADKNKKVYITTTGTSLESGDDGAVGRSNRVNGLISFCRPMSTEAVAGKNPVNHVGKLYNVKAQSISKKIYELGNIKEVIVKLVSKIGQPINKPQIIGVDINGDYDKKVVKELILKELEEFPTKKIIKGKINLF